MRQLFRTGLLMLALLAGACSQLLGPPERIDIDKARLDEALAKRFPYETTWLGAFDVKAAKSPTLRLLPETNRVATEIELSITDRLFKQKLRGALGIESSLRFEPEDGTLRLAQVQVDRFAVAGLPDEVMAQSGRFGAILAEQLVEGMVVYALSEQQQARLKEAKVQVGQVRVTEHGLSVHFEPIPVR